METVREGGPTPLIHIKARRGRQLLDLRELLQYRDLIFFLVIRDITVKYKQTVLGGLWAIIQPLFSMIVFSLFFGKLARIPSDNIPYPVFNFCALVAWTYVANAVATAGNSLIGEANLISKVYFPRLVIPLTPALAGLLDFFIAFVFLLILMVFYGLYPGSAIVVLPFLILLMVITAIGVGSFLAALNARYRDVRYALPFLIQLWLFASPVVYPASLLPGQYRLLYALNPMAGIIEGFRAALVGTLPFPTEMLALSSLAGIVLCAAGIYYFKQTERHFADIL
jgi:lipopolysaccharide transport system permease protein